MRIAAVSSDPEERLQLARAFDRAPVSWDVWLHDEVPEDADVLVCGRETAIEGAVLFDADAPSRVIDDVRRRVEEASVGKRIFVSGATGGSGATTLALHLAAAGGACVVESTGSGIRRRLGLRSARSWSPHHEEELSPLPIAPGLRVLPAPPDASPEDVHRVIARAVSAFSRVIVDCDRAYLDRLVMPGDLCVLVVAPTRPAAERAREILRRDGPRWAVVTNRVGPGSCLTRRRIEEILDRRVAIELPCSAALRDSEDEGVLLTSPFSPWSWKVRKLWRALETA